MKEVVKMIDAIVYYSKHGSTKRYAELAANSINVNIYTVKEAKKKLPKGSSIIYFGPVRGSKVLKFEGLTDKFNVCALCAVGIMPKSALTIENLKNENIMFNPIF